MSSVLFDYVSNMTTVLTLRLGKMTHSNLWKRLLTVWPFFKKEAIWNETKWFAMGVALSIIQAVILIGYIIFTLNTTGTIMIGLVVMIFRYQGDLNTVFEELSIHYGDIVHMETDIKGINPILEDIRQLTRILPAETTTNHWNSFKISNLCFHHDASQRRGRIFENLTFNVKRGEKIALIGTSGGGKSTLLNLLSGLYTPSSVDFNMDGVEFDSLEPLQSITTLVPQDPEIFENTIAFNITLDLPVQREDLDNIINLAGFSRVLEHLPEGLNTDIREKGLNLSFGQKQRLALARGLFAARFSSLILMDEPTSSLDLITEQEILAGVMEAFSNSALIISLHRLHLLPKFDSIIMLHNGEVVANGPVSELLNSSGPVQDLWKSYQKDFDETESKMN